MFWRRSYYLIFLETINAMLKTCRGRMGVPSDYENTKQKDRKPGAMQRDQMDGLSILQKVEMFQYVDVKTEDQGYDLAKSLWLQERIKF